MSYQRPTSGNAFADPALKTTGSSPFHQEHKLDVGDSVEFLILSLAYEDIEVIQSLKGTITNPKNGNPMTVIVDNLGPEVCSKILDVTGTPLSECPSCNVFRIPVWVVSEKRNGKVTQVNALKYLEFSEGVKRSIDDLEKAQDGACAFNKETGRPDYFIRLLVVEGNKGIPKNYKVEPITIGALGKLFGTEAEEAIADHMDEIADQWDELREAMGKRMTVDRVKKQFEPRDAASGNRRSISNRPDLGAAPEDSTPEQGSDEPVTVDKPDDAPSVDRKYTFGGKRK